MGGQLHWHVPRLFRAAPYRVPMEPVLVHGLDAQVLKFLLCLQVRRTRGAQRERDVVRHSEWIRGSWKASSCVPSGSTDLADRER